MYLYQYSCIVQASGDVWFSLCEWQVLQSDASEFCCYFYQMYYAIFLLYVHSTSFTIEMFFWSLGFWIKFYYLKHIHSMKQKTKKQFWLCISIYFFHKLQVCTFFKNSFLCMHACVVSIAQDWNGKIRPILYTAVYL